MALDTKVGGIYVELTAISKEFDKGMQEASRQLDTFDDTAKKTNKGASDNFNKMSGVAQVAFGSMIANAVGGAIQSMKNFVVEGAKLAIDYERQMSSIKAVGGLTREELEKIDKLNKDIAKEGLFNPKEVAEGVEIFVKAGMPLEKLLGGGLKDGMALATAGSISMDEAASTVTASLSTFNREGLTSAQVAQIISGTANATTADVSDLNYALAQSGAVANSVGLNFKDTNAILGVFAQNGLQGSDAGTSLKTMLMRLQPSTEAQYIAMEKLNLITEDGKSAFYDKNGQLKSADEIQKMLKKSTENLTDAEKQSYLTTIFGTDAVRGAIILANEQEGAVSKLKDEIGKVDVYDLAKEKTEGLGGAMDKFNNQLEVIKLETFKGALTALTPVITTLTTFLSENQDAIIGFFTGVGNFFTFLFENGEIILPILSGLVAMLGALVAPAIIAGITALATTIGTFFASFGVLGLVITLIALLIMNWDTVVAVFNAGVEMIKGFLGALWTKVSEIFTNISNFIGEKIMAVVNFFKPLTDVIFYFMQVIGYYLTQAIGTAFNWIWQKVSGVMNMFIGIFTVTWNFLKVLASILYGIFVQPVVNGFRSMLNFVGGIFTSLVNMAKWAVQGLWNAFSGVTSGIGNGIVNVIKGVINGMIGVINAGIRGVNNLIRKIPDIPGIKKPGELPQIPRLNKGGDVRKGQAYIVGDNPDGTLNNTSELFVPRTSGRILSNNDMMNLGSKQPGLVQNITIQSNVFDKNTVAEFYRSTKALAREAGFELS